MDVVPAVLLGDGDRLAADIGDREHLFIAGETGHRRERQRCRRQGGAAARQMEHLRELVGDQDRGGLTRPPARGQGPIEVETEPHPGGPESVRAVEAAEAGGNRLHRMLGLAASGAPRLNPDLGHVAGACRLLSRRHRLEVATRLRIAEHRAPIGQETMRISTLFVVGKPAS